MQQRDTAAPRAVRVKKCGKSALASWRHCGAVNSIRSNAVEEQQVGPTVPGRRLELISNGKPQIDGRLRQNPAYRLTHIYKNTPIGEK